MAGRKLFCTKCGHGIVVDREAPALCPNPTCQSSSWRCATHPTARYALTEADKDFLRTNRIDPEA